MTRTSTRRIALAALVGLLCLGLLGATEGDCQPVPVDPTDPCDPTVWEACGPELVCAADSIDVLGTCGPFAHGQNVGAGYTCGGSIGVGCADGLSCEGLPGPGTIGGTGTCELL